MESRTTLLLCLMGMVGLTFGASIPHCRRECRTVNKNHPRPQYMQVTELQNKSIAQWTIRAENVEGQMDWVAHCTSTCPPTFPNPKPIYVTLFYTEHLKNSTYCRCPFKVAVGCTCAKA